MKKNSLTTAVVAGIAGVAGLANVASAVNLNPDGLGQVLIYPYYTVNAGNSTLLSVVNTTDTVKAVKVRFLEALNSREVLDFNLYLSPFDVWTAAVVSTDDTGAGLLITDDTSCTVPAIPAAGVAFRNFAYTGSFDDDGPNGLDRTREGHIEMIEMGTVLDTNASFNAATSYADAATHVGGVPAGCSRLVNAWAFGNWAVNSTFGANCTTANCGVDNSAPGGLFGAGVIADVAQGSALAYNPDAIDGFYTLATTDLHTGPGFTTPSLSNAQTSALGDADSIVFDNGNLITLDFLTDRPDAVSSVFMHDAIFNEYNTDSDLGAASEWVITFPTKRLHIESTTAARRRPFTDNVDDTDPPVSAGGDAVEGLVFDPSGSCEVIDISFFDREEGPDAPLPVVDFSPLPEGEDATLALCYEANVVTWNQEAAVTAGESLVLGSRTVANNINLRDASGNDVTAGWVRMGMGDDTNFLLDGVENAGAAPRNQLFGLPVTGFWAANYVNANAAPGVLANYSQIHKHRASRESQSVLVSGEGTAGETITATGFAAS